ncbi:hypothetical protein BDU57DRAFT_449622 [Ampelomyces quisqualis]|uniref:Ras guanine nucleotide exchange factor domain-containing protein n=1 Tax=Ampelomyces quisqualis TaxID=50730 RepID=A0A6A5QKZ3_AMPQU|nr:hypothetical protein BDU57DRAFT_449622 [Ampelomyces quisqualis]
MPSSAPSSSRPSAPSSRPSAPSSSRPSAPASSRPSPVPIGPRLYDALTANPDDSTVVRFSATGQILAATPSRLVAHITSPSFVDYELLSDFFLTFRAFLTAKDLVAYLISRLRWAVDRQDDFGRIVRVRTFVALRHWILNYLVDDFVPTYQLRTYFCYLVNSLYNDLRIREDGGGGDIKIVGELKKCWTRTCAMYWETEDAIGQTSPDHELLPGGQAGSQASMEEIAQIPPTPTTPKRQNDRDTKETMGSNPSDHFASRHMDWAQRARHTPQNSLSSPYIPSHECETAAVPLSPASEQSMHILSCSIPVRGLNKSEPGLELPLYPHPVPAGTARLAASPQQAPSIIQMHRPSPVHKRSGSFSDALRDGRALLSIPKHASPETAASVVASMPGSLVRGGLFQPGSPYIETRTLRQARSHVLREREPVATQDVERSTHPHGPGMKKIFGSHRHNASPPDLGGFEFEFEHGSTSNSDGHERLVRKYDPRVHSNITSGSKSILIIDDTDRPPLPVISMPLPTQMKENGDEALTTEIHQRGILTDERTTDGSIHMLQRSELYDDPQPSTAIEQRESRPDSVATFQTMSSNNDPFFLDTPSIGSAAPAHLEHMQRPHSTGSVSNRTHSVTNSVVLRTELCIDPSAEPGQQAVKPATEVATKKTISLVDTHSSQPNLRPSFEAEVAKLAALPDDTDDEGGVELALMKLEGRYEKRLSSNGSTQIATDADVDYYKPSGAFKRHVGDTDNSYEHGARDDTEDVLHRPLAPTNQDGQDMYQFPAENFNRRMPATMRPSAKPSPLQLATTLSPQVTRTNPSMSPNSSLEHVVETDSMKRMRTNLVWPQSSIARASFLLDEDEELSDTDTIGGRSDGTSRERSFFDDEPAIMERESNALPTHPMRHLSIPPLAVDSLKQPISNPTIIERGLPTPGLTPIASRANNQTFGSPIHLADSPIEPAVQQDKLEAPATHMPFVLAYDSEILAQQFTIIEKDALDEIDWKELIELRWKQSSPQICDWVHYLRTEEARGVDIVIARFNLVVKWVVSECVLTEDIQERARCIVKYIHIATHARRLRNYATMYQIAIALISNDVSRLRQTWALVPAAELHIMKDLEALVQPLKNFHNLRLEMETATVDDGCIPFIGIYTRDLIYNAQKPAFVDAPPVGGERLVNFDRHHIAATIVKNLLRLLEASSKYTFKVEPHIISKCLWLAALTDDEISKRSRMYFAGVAMHVPMLAVEGLNRYFQVCLRNTALCSTMSNLQRTDSEPPPSIRVEEPVLSSSPTMDDIASQSRTRDQRTLKGTFSFGQRRKHSPNVEWKEKWTKDTWKQGRVLLIDYCGTEHSGEGRRKIAAQEFCNIDSLRRFYRKEHLSGQAALRVIHVQNASWATRFLLRKFNIDASGDLVGTTFGPWVRYKRPQQRGGKLVLNGKTFRTQRDPWRGIGRAAFGCDYLKHYEKQSISPAGVNPLMELNHYDDADQPCYGFDVYVQRLSVYVQLSDGSAGQAVDPDIPNPYNEEAYEDYQRLKKSYGNVDANEHQERYIPKLRTLDNSNTIIIFENSQSGSVKDTLIGARQELESRWRRLTFYLPLEDMGNDDMLATECMDFILKDIFKALAYNSNRFLAACETHVGILEDKIYEDPADESRAPELWKNSAQWLKVERLLYIHADMVAEMQSHLQELAPGGPKDDDPWLGSVPDELEKLTGTWERDIITPTSGLSDLMYKSVGIRDSRHSLQLGLSMWRLSWITFIFLPLTFTVGFFGMNVNTFAENPPIKWWFIVSCPTLAAVVILWYGVKHSLSTQRQNPLRRGVYEALYHDLATKHASLWSRTGPRPGIVPVGWWNGLKWRLVTRWFGTNKLKLSTAVNDPAIQEFGAWSLAKQYLVRRWLVDLPVVVPTTLPISVSQQHGDVGVDAMDKDLGAVGELLSIATPVAIAELDPPAARTLQQRIPIERLRSLSPSGSDGASGRERRASLGGDSEVMVEIQRRE